MECTRSTKLRCLRWDMIFYELRDDSCWFYVFDVFSTYCNTCLESENVQNIGKPPQRNRNATVLQPEPRDPEDFPSCQDMNNLCLCRGRGANSHPGSMKRSIQRHAAKKSLADIIRNAVQMEVGLGIKVVQRHGKLLSSTNNSTWSGFFCGNLWWLERTIGIVGIVLVCL